MRIVVALGGNAVIRYDEKGTLKQQLHNVLETAKHIADLVAIGHTVCITHGNGPQAGNLLLEQPGMTLDIIGAETQGQIGYMLELALENEFRKRKIMKDVVTVITQVLVDAKDQAFKNPAKPIGPFYKQKKKGMKHIEGKGWRKVVPSPMPLKILEIEEIKQLLKTAVVIACGGGGIPVVKKGGQLKGVEAVIDKDLAGQLLANGIKADLFLILTDVPHIYQPKSFFFRGGLGGAPPKAIKKLTLAEAKKLLPSLESGSMKPKVLAAIKFLEDHKPANHPVGDYAGGKKVIITSPALAKKALAGKVGTLIE